MNVVVLVGRFTQDPVLRTTQSGTSLANFSLAVDRKFKSENQPDVDFINCVAWGRTAEVICQYLTKGRQIAVQGRLQTGSYQAKDGSTRYTTDVVVESFDFIGSRSDNTYNPQSSYNNQSNYQSNQNQSPLEIDDDFSLLAEDDDVPF